MYNTLYVCMYVCMYIEQFFDFFLRGCSFFFGFVVFLRRETHFEIVYDSLNVAESGDAAKGS